MTNQAQPQQQLPDLVQQEPESLQRSFETAYELSVEFGQKLFDALVKSHSGFHDLPPAERMSSYQRLNAMYGDPTVWLMELAHINPPEAQWTAKDLSSLLKRGYNEPQNGNGALG